MNMRTRLASAIAFAMTCFLGSAFAQLSFTVTDLGTLGGNTSTAAGIAGQGTNAAGMVVGSSTTSDNSEHAFLFANGQMLDLNNLCDLSQSDFKVLTAARAINDSCVIIGDGLTSNGDKHAFMLTPVAMDGGRWFYRCCEWVWIQEGGGWWWEENCGCYKWHGPPGPHPPCPPRPPICWWFMPCPPPCHHPTPTPPPGQTPTPPPECWCCINGQVILTTPEKCRERDGQCYSSKEEAIRHCRDLCWCCINGHVFQVPVADCRQRGGQCYPSREEADRECRGQRPTPTPGQTPGITLIPGAQQTPTPPPRRTRSPHGKGSSTPVIGKPLRNKPTPTPSRGRTPSRKKPTPTPPIIR